MARDLSETPFSYPYKSRMHSGIAPLALFLLETRARRFHTASSSVEFSVGFSEQSFGGMLRGKLETVQRLRGSGG